MREYYGQLGVALDRIGTISYGSEKPADPAHSEDAWAKNRRAETKIRSTKQTTDNSINKEASYFEVFAGDKRILRATA